MKRNSKAVVLVMGMLLLSLFTAACSDGGPGAMATKAASATPTKAAVTQTPEVTASPTATPEPAKVSRTSEESISSLVSPLFTDSETGNEVEHLFDGDPDTRWAGAFSQWPAELVFDLNEVYSVGLFEIAWYTDTREYYYTVSVSLDNVNYTQIIDNMEGGGLGYSEDRLLGTQARYVKYSIYGHSSNNAFVSIYEMEVLAYRLSDGDRYTVDQDAKTITLSETMTKKDFVENLRITGTYELSVPGEEAELISAGDTVTVSCGSSIVEYTVISA